MTLRFPTLPEPDILDPSSYEQIFDRKLADFSTNFPEYSNVEEGDPVYALIQASAFDELNIRKRVNDAYNQTLLPYASGANLDNLVSLVGLTRQIKEAATFDEDGIELTPEVLETDESLRLRAYLIWHSLSPGSFGHYKTHALNSSPEIRDAFPKNTADGEVTIYIQSEDSGGGVPSSALLTTVTNYMNEASRKTLCDSLVISAITLVNYTIVAEITVELELDRATVLAEVQAAADAFALDQEVIDQDIALSRFYAVLSPTGVSGVTLTQPTADITTTDSQVPHATAVTITAA